MGEQFLGAYPTFGPGHPEDAAVEVEIVFGAHAFVEAGELEQRTAMGPNRGGVRARVEAQHVGLTRRRFEQTQKQVDGGGFAGAVGAEEAKDNALRHVDRQVVDCGDGTKGAG